MGLFYTALERADRKAAESEAAKAEAQPAAPAAPEAGQPALVRTWEEAAQRDLAGYPLATPEAAAPADDPAQAAETVEWDAASLGAAANPTGIAREQYRILRTRLLEAMHGRGLRTLLVTSAVPGEGKTMVTANLALQLSSLGEGRVLLIDADLRRAGLSASLRPAPVAGLSDYLKGEVGLSQVLRDVNPWLSILPTRCTQEEGPELLACQGMVELLQRMRESFDLVLIDGAPVGPVADSRILARLADASLLVVRAQGAPGEDVERAAELLRPRLLGAVLNGAEEKRRRGYGSYGSYGGYGAKPAAADQKEPS